jgi:hypothetical protein
LGLLLILLLYEDNRMNEQLIVQVALKYNCLSLSLSLLKI